MLSLAIIVLALALPAAPAAAATFSNTATITTPDPSCPTMPGPSNLYPSSIDVSGVTGLVSDVNVVLHGVTHPFEGDLGVLLVGPGGAARSLVLLSDAGTGSLSNATLTFDDAAPSQVPQNVGWGGGAGTASSTKPTDYLELGLADTYPSAPSPLNHPAPTASSTLASIYNGTNPNGTWSLYVLDDACSAPDPPSTIGGGWSLDITSSAGAATSTAVASSPNPSTTGQTVTTTASITSGGSAVTAGTVTFAEGVTTLAANVPLNASGQATFTKSSFPEGNHPITATFNGTASFATSNGTTNQRVDNPTTVTGSTYCNAGPISIPSVGSATPYPSQIFVTGVLGSVRTVTVQLKNVSHQFAEDVDVLLAGPGAANNLVLVSDAGNGSAPTSNVSVTFDDAAPGSLPATGAWGIANSAVSSKPVNYVGGVGEIDVFPAPAPVTFASPSPTGSATLATAFGGSTANGTWKLYVVDDAGGDAGAIAGGWCVTISALDTIAPTTTITRSPASPNGTSGIYTTAVHETVTASDAGSGVAETRCVLDPPSAPATFDALPAGCAYTGAGADVSTDGSHVLYAASRDVTGNKSTPVSNAFTIDKTPPAGGGMTTPPPGPPPGSIAPPGPLDGGAFSILAARAGATGTITLTLHVPRAGKLALKLTRKAKRAGHRRKTITTSYVKAQRTLTVPGTIVLTLKPSRRVLRSLTRGRRTKITIRAVFTPAAGTASTKTTSVTVKLH